ncbi:MAG: hypothetical protein ACI9TY_000861 [Alphaproteobacteria bacterium]|jgi:hypothetical protein
MPQHELYIKQQDKTRDTVHELTERYGKENTSVLCMDYCTPKTKSGTKLCDVLRHYILSQICKDESIESAVSHAEQSTIIIDFGQYHTMSSDASLLQEDLYKTLLNARDIKIEYLGKRYSIATDRMKFIYLLRNRLCMDYEPLLRDQFRYLPLLNFVLSNVT